MLDDVITTITQYNMLELEDKVIVAVSGGPDSVSLLHILWCLKDKWRLNLHIAHLNHSLRGEEAEKDACFVKGLAKRYGFPITLREVDVLKWSQEKKVSLEVGARRLRYEFLVGVAESVNARKIALGHNANDNIETILMRLIRGTGICGLKGIPPDRSLNDNLKIIRPLINITSLQIKDYIAQNNLEYRIDSSNLKPIYLRNKIRLELLPLMLEYNRKFKEALLKTASLWEKDDEYLNEIARIEFSKALLKSNKRIILDLGKITYLPQAILSRILREGIRLAKGNLERVTYRHIAQIIRLIDRGPSQGEVYLPDRIKIQREYEHIIIYREEEKRDRDKKIGFEYPINVPGETRIIFLNTELQTEILERDSSFFIPHPSLNIAHFDYDKVKLPLILRSRAPGDRFTPLGMKGRKKVKDFFIDLKIGKLDREKIPLLLDKEGIIWVVGYRIDDRVRISRDTKRILKVSYHVSCE
ncbi:MAG: tRNA lysidine(34) synthetase TilS [bacterium]|nr:tRNA lysidine(34) synthetase TilS [bacterium]